MQHVEREGAATCTSNRADNPRAKKGWQQWLRLASPCAPSWWLLPEVPRPLRQAARAWLPAAEEWGPPRSTFQRYRRSQQVRAGVPVLWGWPRAHGELGLPAAPAVGACCRLQAALRPLAPLTCQPERAPASAGRARPPVPAWPAGVGRSAAAGRAAPGAALPGASPGLGRWASAACHPAAGCSYGSATMKCTK